jgi:predicted ABC-type ATPase
MAAARVANRVQQCGHDVPAADIRRRYSTGLRNLFEMYLPILNGCWLYDAPRLPPKLIASEQRKKLAVKQERLFCPIQRQAELSREKEE